MHRVGAHTGAKDTSVHGRPGSPNRPLLLAFRGFGLLADDRRGHSGQRRVSENQAGEEDDLSGSLGDGTRAVDARPERAQDGTGELERRPRLDREWQVVLPAARLRDPVRGVRVRVRAGRVPAVIVEMIFGSATWWRRWPPLRRKVRRAPSSRRTGPSG